MPTTQDIEAGLAPQGMGSPEPTPQLRLTPPPEVPYRPPTQIVDRQAYLTQQQQAAAQAQLDRINAIQQRFVNPVRQAYQQVPSLLDQENARAAMGNQQAAQWTQQQPFSGGTAQSGVQRAISDAQQQAMQQASRASIVATTANRALMVDPHDYGYNENDARTWQPAYDAAANEALRRQQMGINAQVVPLGQTGVGPEQALGQITRGATQEIPGAKAVQGVVGEAARRGVQGANLLAGGPLGAAVDVGVNRGLEAAGLPQPSKVVGHALENTAGFAAETLVPTEVWQAALELTPAGFTGGVPALARAVRKGSPEAIAALTRAGEKLGAREEVQTALRRMASESGAIKLPFGLGEKAAPEVVSNAERVAQLTEQQKNIRQMITTLTTPEANRALSGNVKTVLDIAERYPADSPARQDLLKVLEPKIAALDPLEQKFVRETLMALPSKEARKAATQAQRASQAVRSATAFEDTAGTVPEKVAASFAAKSGKQAQRFEPIGSKFTDAEQAALHDRIVQAWQSGKISVFERDNLVDALNLLMTGTRINSIRPLNLAPYEITGLGKVFGPEVEAAIAKSPMRNLSNVDKFVDVLNLPRALVTAFDISAAGRQGILLTARNPVEAFKSFAPMFKAMASEEGFRKTSQNIVNNPKFQDGVAHGLWLSDIGGGAGGEEAFISHIASKLPFVRGSERGYVTYLDNMRMLNYEKMSNRLEQFAATHDGWDVARTDAVKSQIATFLNHATGRGDLKQLDKFVPALNAVFFSPRYFASRFQSVWDMVRPGADSYTRKVAFENLGAFVGTGMLALTALKQMGWADVEVNPQSADFGRIKIGPTRIDFWGGYQPIARYIAQISTGHVKNTSTGVTGFVNPGTSAMRFFRSKLSPAGAMVYDYIPGLQTDYQGNDLIINPRDLGPNKETGALAWNTFATKLLPLSIQDAIQGYHATGSWAPTRANLIRGATGAGVSAVGGGISSYEPTEKQQATKEKAGATSDLAQTGVPFTGKKVDFAQPILNAHPAGADKPSQRDAIVSVLKIDVPKDASLSDMRQAYIDQKTDLWLKQNPGKSKAEAAYVLGQGFDRQPGVKSVSSAANDSEMNYWRAHPDKLKQALETGVTEYSAEKHRIAYGS